MVITSTAIAFILLAIGLIFLGWRFLGTLQKTQQSTNDNHLGFLLGFCFIATALHNGTLGVGALLFANNSTALFGVSIIAHIFLTSFALLSLYTAYYIFLPKTSPVPPMAITGILSFIGLVAAISSKERPTLTPQMGIDWNLGFLHSLITFFLLAVGLLIFFYIFLQLFRQAKTMEIRVLSFTIAGTALVGAMNTFVRLILLYRAPAALRTSTLDIGIGTIGVIFIVGFIVIPLARSWLKR